MARTNRESSENFSDSGIDESKILSSMENFNINEILSDESLQDDETQKTDMIDFESDSDESPQSKAQRSYNDTFFDSNDVLSADQLKMQLKAFLQNKTKQIKHMCLQNHESLLVSYLELESAYPELVPLLVKHTEAFLSVFSNVLAETVASSFPNYHLIRPKISVRISDVPHVQSLRALRNSHLGTLVRVRGIVTRRTGILPQLAIATYMCHRCASPFGPLIFDPDVPRICPGCQSRGPHTVVSNETAYSDLQRGNLQEAPGSVPSGMLPRQKEILFRGELVDSAKPGELVDIVGIYRNIFVPSAHSRGAPVFSTAIDALHVVKDSTAFVAENHSAVLALSRHPRVYQILLNSFAPGICGHIAAKRAVLLALFGGEPRIAPGHSVRGDINVLLLGDPGTAKSQLLRYASVIAPRAILATGQGSSAVGLTACVRRDPVSKEYTLEGGALVLADRGICCIDEFDKMDETDRVSIHEAMEQQSISISKAGIVASLHSRCAVIAAANPKKGTYNSALSFPQNVNLSDPILSRFDLLCVLRDVVGPDDKITAEYIVNSHIEMLRESDEFGSEHLFGDENVTTKEKQGSKDIFDQFLAGSDSENNQPPHKKIKKNLGNKIKGTDSNNIDNMTTEVSQELLKSYIAYARENCHPTISSLDLSKISSLYADLRAQSAVVNSIPITARYLESIIRLSVAFAKIHLRPCVISDDINNAIEVLLECFMNLQKFSVCKILRKKFSKYLRTNFEELMYILNEIFLEKMKIQAKQEIKVKEFEFRVKEAGLQPNADFYMSKEFEIAGYVHVNGVIFKTL